MRHSQKGRALTCAWQTPPPSNAMSSLSTYKTESFATTMMDGNGTTVQSALAVSSTVALGGLLVVQLFTPSDPIGRCLRFWKQLNVHESNLTSSKTVDSSITAYQDLHQKEADKRTSSYQELVNAYYDLATVFYEWGWGSCFHFSFQYRFESFAESIRRHEYHLASQLRLGPNSHVVDVGCGIGGPMRNIARFFRGLNVRITGITLNEYQVMRGNELNRQDGLAEVCKSIQGDFMKLPFENASLDGAYAIEATCHAPDRVACYSEIARTLKSGAVFACYEWCMTDKYDPNDPEHQRLKKDIEIGNGLPDIITTRECLQAMKDAGYEILHEHDLALEEGVQPWMTPLMPSWNPLSQRFQFNCVGGPLTNATIYLLELLRIAPAGTVKTQKVLQAGGFALRDAGREKIFTTMYLMVGRKK